MKGVGAIYPVPDFLFGFTATIAQKILLTAGYIGSVPYSFIEFGRFISPVFNIIFLFLLLFFARKYILEIKESWPLYILMLFLLFLPLHMYHGSVINYNLLADSLLLIAVLTTFHFRDAWIKLEKAFIANGYKSFPLDVIRPVILSAALFGFSFGILLATKWIYYSIILIIAIQYIFLLFRYLYFNKQGRVFYFAMMSFMVFAMLSCGVFIYLILIFKSVRANPVEVTDMMFNNIIKGNMGRFPLFSGLSRRLVVLYEIIVIPNIGYVNAVAGTLGIIFFTISAFRKKNLSMIMAAIWSLLIAAQTLYAYIMIFDPASMSRNTLLLGIFVVYSVYFLTVLIKWIQQYLHSDKIYNVVKVFLIIIFSVEICLAGMSYIIFISHKAPRYLAQEYIKNHLDPLKSFAVMRHPVYTIYPFYPNLMGRTFTVTDHSEVGERYELIKTEEGSEELIRKDNADYWVIGSYDPCFTYNKEEDVTNLKNALARTGYLARRFEPDLFERIPFIDKIYKFYLKRLLHSSKTGGLFSPYYIEIYGKNGSS